VHFVGHVPYQSFLAALQISSAHVYLTYPLVLSWSLLEAMNAGCVVIASDTPPVRELVRHGDTGMLVPFFDFEQLPDRVTEALADPRRFDAMRINPRQYTRDQFDMERICLPQMLELIQSKAGFSPTLTGSPKLWPGKKPELTPVCAETNTAQSEQKSESTNRARLIPKRAASNKPAKSLGRTGI
jgi:hypothetical protein